MKNAVMNRNIFLPQTSDNEPMRGADKKLNNPFTPIITPFNINAWSCNQRLMRVLITVVKLNLECCVEDPDHGSSDESPGEEL